MRRRSGHVPSVGPAVFVGLAGAVAALVIAVGIGIAAVRWAHHLSAFAEIAALVIVGLLVLAIVTHRLVPGVRRRTILELDLEVPLREERAAGPASALGLLDGRGPTLREAVDTIERAARDRRVSALFARIGQASGLGQVQELRDAVATFRASGKPTIAFSETFGEFSAGNGSYYLATAFDEIALQPSGDVNLTGLMASVTFVRGALDKVGVVPRLGHRREYKTAMNVLTETGFTPAHRESLASVVDSQFDQIVQGVSEQRRMTKDAVRGLIDAGPFSATAGLDAGLVDRVAYRDEVIADLKERVGEGAVLLDGGGYTKRSRPRRSKGDSVALILGVGSIRRGRSGGFNPLDRRRSMGSDTIASAFRAAIDDKRVKAILFRIDSPGGSYVASDTIWRETVRARHAGKPVIVSMGNVAGSGGYFVAMAADKIVAQPGTITGSIGVFAGKPVTAELRTKLGLATEEVHSGAHATMWSDALDYSPAAWDRVQSFLDRAYEDFTDKAAARARSHPRARRGGGPRPDLDRRRGAADRPGRRAGRLRYCVTSGTRGDRSPAGRGIAYQVVPPVDESARPPSSHATCRQRRRIRLRRHDHRGRGSQLDRPNGAFRQ